MGYVSNSQGTFSPKETHRDDLHGVAIPSFVEDRKTRIFILANTFFMVSNKEKRLEKTPRS